MVITRNTVSESSEIQSPLLNDTVEGSVDYKAAQSTDATPVPGGAEFMERFAFYGILSNLITYFTGSLGQSTATAAENVNAWSGTTHLLALVGAFVADSFLGRYRTIVFASFIYVLGLAGLTLAATLTYFSPSGCPNTDTVASCSNPFQAVLVFFSLYLIAVGQGGHKPCIQAFGANQFDGEDPEERLARSSFFNWWFFSCSIGILLSRLVLIYIQDNLNWTSGFGIPCIMMIIGLFIFLFGTKSYRCRVKVEKTGAFQRIGQVFVAAIRNWGTSPSLEEASELLPHHSSEQFKFLNRALLTPTRLKDGGKVCSPTEVEEAKAILKLVTIWPTCLVYAVVSAQVSTFCTKQGVTMDRSISPAFNIPPASLQSISSISNILCISIYDRAFVPIARILTRKPSGVTMLQRIGIGLFTSVLSMTIAALVEMKRLQVVQEYGLVDMPNVMIPMSVCWLIPQYILFGVADAFTIVGVQEFFYDQIPSELKSMGISLYLSIYGVGSFISSFLVSAIDKATGVEGHDSWLANNLNRGHLDYFYWLLAGLSMVQLIAFLCFTKNYEYNSYR